MYYIRPGNRIYLNSREVDNDILLLLRVVLTKIDLEFARLHDGF